jgi:hypothetical protein
VWVDEIRPTTSRVHRRRIVLGLALGVVAGAVAVAVAVGLLPITAAAIPAVTAVGAAWLLRSSPERTLGPRSYPLPNWDYPQTNVDSSQDVLAAEEAREARVGFFGRLRVTPKTLIIERLLGMTAARIEDLAWAYGVRDPNRRWIPFVTDASLVLKFSDGSELTFPCFNRQVIPCLSALRYFAGHVALGWDAELASSWETNRAAFVASVQARLGRISGAGGDA